MAEIKINIALAEEEAGALLDAKNVADNLIQQCFAMNISQDITDQLGLIADSIDNFLSMPEITIQDDN